MTNWLRTQHNGVPSKAVAESQMQNISSLVLQLLRTRDGRSQENGEQDPKHGDIAASSHPTKN